MSTNEFSICNTIRQGRERLNLTQAQVAEKLHINITHYGNIERGTSNPSNQLFLRIFQLLNISVDDCLLSRDINDDVSRQIIRLISQCSEKERLIILANIRTLLEYRDIDSTNYSKE